MLGWLEPNPLVDLDCDDSSQNPLSEPVKEKEAFDKIVPVRKEKNEEGTLLWQVKEHGYEGHKFDENGVGILFVKK